MPTLSFARAPFWALTVYALCYSFWNASVMIWTLGKAFRSGNPDLHPLHPDRCGGLQPIREYSNVIAVGIGAIGVHISLVTVNEVARGTLLGAYPSMLGIALYIPLAPLLYLLLLGTAHDAMRRAKDAELLRLSSEVNQHYSRVVGGDEADIKKLKHLQELYAMVDRFPVWPFALGSLGPLATRVYASLLPGLISIMVQYVAKQFAG